MSNLKMIKFNNFIGDNQIGEKYNPGIKKSEIRIKGLGGQRCVTFFILPLHPLRPLTIPESLLPSVPGIDRIPPSPLSECSPGRPDNIGSPFLPDR
ncbi:MAG: hypothetical protein ACFFBZ_16335 [Promethearchaeota archaeon]